MSIESGIRNRIEQLLKEAASLRHGATEHGQARDNYHLEQCSGWISAAMHVVGIATDERGPYWTRAESFGRHNYGYAIPRGVGEAAELLKHLLADMDAGLLGSVADRARAETFGDFLDHGKAYLDDGKVREAGVIAGVVFEDTVRRICRKHSIEERDVKLDSLISALVSADVLTQMKAKRARVAAAVRTKATHAQWDEFTPSDVAEAIALTREVVETQLDS